MEKIFINEQEKLFFREGKITYLRPLLKRDLCPEYLAWLNNPDLNKYSSHFRTWPTTEKDLDDFYANTKSNHHIVFATCCNKTGKHFGNCSLDDIDWVNRNAHFNINIGIKEYRTIHFLDIFNIIAEFSFNTLNLNKLCGGAEIPGILELHERLGWKKEGVLRKHFYREGKYVDLVLFAIFKEDFLKLK
jgi:RimJ/RimL family protein N-acetyltransferase